MLSKHNKQAIVRELFISCMELQERDKLFKPGMTVIDLGQRPVVGRNCCQTGRNQRACDCVGYIAHGTY